MQIDPRTYHLLEEEVHDARATARVIQTWAEWLLPDNRHHEAARRRFPTPEDFYRFIVERYTNDKGNQAARFEFVMRPNSGTDDTVRAIVEEQHD